MKKIILLFAVILVTVSLEAQQFRGMFAPVKEHPYFASELTADRNLNGIMLLRIGAGITGTETLYNKTENKLEQRGIIRVGGGFSFGHHKLLSDGTIYNDWSLNALVLTPPEGLLDEPLEVPISIAVTVSALEILQMGINIIPKYFHDGDYFPISLIWGLQYSF